MAERVGFEPTIRGYRIHAFQACAFSRSATSPVRRNIGAALRPCKVWARSVWPGSAPLAFLLHGFIGGIDGGEAVVGERHELLRQTFRG